MQRSRRPLIIIVIALLVGLLAAAVVVPRRTLTAKRDAADTAFAALRPSLDARYATVPSILTALDAAGARDRTPTRALRTSFARWNATAKGTDPAALTDAANRVEGDVARTRALVGADDRLKNVAALTAAYVQYDRALPSARLVTASNDAVAAYDAARRGFLRRIAASAGGFEPRPAYLPVSP
jgi:hypothetical protein